jgi:oligopeptide transport system substrate-binding protein
MTLTAYPPPRSSPPRLPQRLGRTLGIGLLAWGATGCSQPSSPERAGPILHRGLSGEPATLDPASVGDTFSREVIEDLYEGLTAESPSGEVIPGVAASWTSDATGLQYTFQLRPDARWSNGKPVRAQDFIAAWQRVLDPKTASPVADNLRLLKNASAIIEGRAPSSALGAEAKSDSTLVVSLEQPAPYFPEILAHPAAYPIYSADSAKSHRAATWVSDGAYVLSSWSPATAIELKKNYNYWNAKTVAIPDVQYLIASDAQAQYMRYRTGDLEMTDTVPENIVADLRREHAREFLSAPILTTAYYGLNLTAGPCQSSAALRQALSLAIDRRRLIDALAYGQLPAYGLVAPGTWNYTPQAPAWKDWPDDKRIDEAKRLYAAAGFSVTSPLHLRLLYNSNPAIKRTAILVAAMWHETLGIETALTEEEYRVFLESRHDHRRWDVARLAWSADFNDAGNFLTALRSHSSNNDPGYSNPAFDEHLDLAARTADPAARRAILEESERLMLGDYPVIPLYYFVSKRMVKPNLHGVIANPFNLIRSQTLTLEAAG